MTNSLILRFFTSDLDAATESYLNALDKSTTDVIPVEADDQGSLSKSFLSSLEAYLQRDSKCSLVLIGAHGDADSDKFYLRDPKKEISGKELARALSPYSGNIKKIKIYSCYSGKGDCCLAKTFAEITQVKTIGYRHLVYIGKSPAPRVLPTFSEKENRKFSRVAFIPQDRDTIYEDLSKERALLLKHPEFFDLSNPKFKQDKEVVLAAVSHEGTALEYASEELRDDPDVVLAAVLDEGMALEHASERLRDDVKIVLNALSQDAMALGFASEFLRSVPEIVTFAVKQTGMALQFADEKSRADRTIVLEAIREYGPALTFASEALRDNQEFLLSAIEIYSSAFNFASEALRTNREFLLAAVQKNGLILKNVAEPFKKDKALALAAIQQNCLALEYADKSLLKDLDVMLAAVQQDHRFFKYADRSLKTDPTLLLAESQKTIKLPDEES